MTDRESEAAFDFDEFIPKSSWGWLAGAECGIPECPSKSFTLLRQKVVRKFRSRKFLIVRDIQCRNCGYHWRQSEELGSRVSISKPAFMRLSKAES